MILIGRHVYFTGQFDRTIADVLLSFAKPDDRVLDIGANIGYISSVLLKCLPEAHVVAIEPQPDVYQILKQNLDRISSNRSKTLRVAISNHQGTGRMQVRQGNTGAAKVIEDQLSDNTEINEIEIIDGEELIKRSCLDRVDLIKIDVEGHERQVLESMENEIAKYRPRAILFECFDNMLQDDHQIVKLFNRLEYRLFGIKKSLLSWRLIPLEQLSAKHARCTDYVARPI